MQRVKKILLDDFKRANKVRKQKLAEKYGYTVEEYLTFLTMDNQESNVNVTKKPIVHNIHIIDMSTSMRADNKYLAALGGVNNDILNLKNENNVDYLETLIVFATKIETIINRTDIKCVSEDQSYTTSGLTTLYDCVGAVLTNILQNKRDEKTLVKIFTDGDDNNSIVYSANRIATLIKKCEKIGVTITFIGVKKDVRYIIKNLNIDESNTLSHNNTSVGIKKAFDETILATMDYSKSVARGEDVQKNFYKKVGKL